MDKTIFLKAGLTNKETEVYLALLELGEAKVSQIVDRVNVSVSKVYEILDRLNKKGLVSEVLKGKSRRFAAAQPSRLLDYLEKKQEELNKVNSEMKVILPQLEALQKIAVNQEAKVYIGYEGLRTAFDFLLQTLGKGENYAGFVASLEDRKDPVTVSILLQYHKKRANKGITAGVLAGEELHEVFKKEPFSSYKKFNVRFLPQQTLSNILIFKDNIFLYTGVKNPVGFILTSKNLAETFRKFFNSSWAISKS